jgi:hypothetical protein
VSRNPIAERAGELLRETLGDDVSDEDALRGRMAVVDAVETKRSLFGGARRKWLLAVALAVVATVIAFVSLRKSALDYEVTGAEVASGYIVVPSPGVPATVSFSDGTRIELAESARARVRDVGRDGATILLEAGALSANVVHRGKSTAWKVEAGPYSVHVVGTRFSVTWRATPRTLTVRVVEGEVFVSGGLANQGVSVRAGQTLTANDETSQLLVRPSDPPELAGASDAGSSDSGRPEAEQTTDAGPSSSGQPPPRSSGSLGETLSWAQRVGRGESRAVVEEAEERGIDGVLATSSLSDLGALADAARYSGKSGLAQRALSTMRLRFAGSQPAREAAFLLGRLADDGGKSPAGALKWYETYLAEGGGRHSHDAEGRRMIATERTRGRSAAKPLAEAYLSRHAQGSYARAARAILGIDAGSGTD